MTKTDVKIISAEEIANLLASGNMSIGKKHEPFGLFYGEDYNPETGKKFFTGIDNLYGYAFVESFADLPSCLYWLQGGTKKPEDNADQYYPIGSNLPVKVSRNGHCMMICFDEMLEGDITEYGAVLEVVKNDLVMIGRKADHSDALPYTPERFALREDGVFVFGDYVLTKHINAFNGKTSFWLSKRGCTLAQYCFTADSQNEVMWRVEHGMKGYIDLLESQLSTVTPKQQYAVLFTYNFDCHSEVFLFDNEDAARGFLRLAYEEELRIETEENEWLLNAYHEPDWTYASIGHVIEELGETDVCEYHVTAVTYR